MDRHHDEVNNHYQFRLQITLELEDDVMLFVLPFLKERDERKCRAGVLSIFLTVKAYRWLEFYRLGE